MSLIVHHCVSWFSVSASSFLYWDCLCLIYASGFVFFGLFIQTDGSVPNTLVIANCEVVKPRVAAAEHISQVMSRQACCMIFHNPPPHSSIYFPLSCHEDALSL